MDYKDTGGNFGGVVTMFIILTVFMASQLYTCVKTRTVQLKYMQFIIQLCLQVAKKNVGMQRAKNIPHHLKNKEGQFAVPAVVMHHCNEDSVVLAQVQANRLKERNTTLLQTDT